MFNVHGGHPMGILPMLPDLGCRHPVPVFVLSIPDTNNVPFVSPFRFSQFCFRRLTFAQHDQAHPNVSSFRLLPVNRALNFHTAV